MVSYADWNRAVHTAYKNLGGTYGAEGIAPAITRAAARWWRENKEQIIDLSLDAAVKLAEELIREYRGPFPG